MDTTGTELDGQIALVTGGSSGIGAEIARRFAREGAHVVLVGTDGAKAERAARQIRSEGRKAYARATDVGSFVNATDLVRDCLERFGKIDILVNSAGVWGPTVTGSLAEEDVNRLLSVNLKGVLGMVNAVCPDMKRRRQGVIINIASVAGLVAGPGFSVYCATKAAVLMLTKVHALELAPFDIRVNAIAPGMTESPMTAALQHSPDMAEQRNKRRMITPSNRIFTPADEIAEAALMLAGNRVRSMHGSVMVLDEGRAAGTPDRHA